MLGHVVVAAPSVGAHSGAGDEKLIETVELLSGRDIGLRSLTESIDTTTAGGKLVLHIFGALAEFDRSIIRERTKAGLEAARARGRASRTSSKLWVYIAQDNPAAADRVLDEGL